MEPIDQTPWEITVQTTAFLRNGSWQLMSIARARRGEVLICCVADESGNAIDGVQQTICQLYPSNVEGRGAGGEA